MKLSFKSISVILSLFAAIHAQGQYNPGDFTKACMERLNNGLTFLKSYDIDGQGGARDKVEYSYVFSKDSNYSLSICSNSSSGTTDGIVASIYDSNRNLVFTNNVNGRLYDQFSYPCKATGIYHITFTFEGSAAYCGGAVLGFKRN